MSLTPEDCINYLEALRTQLFRRIKESELIDEFGDEIMLSSKMNVIINEEVDDIIRQIGEKYNAGKEKVQL